MQIWDLCEQQSSRTTRLKRITDHQNPSQTKKTWRQHVPHSSRSPPPLPATLSEVTNQFVVELESAVSTQPNQTVQYVSSLWCFNLVGLWYNTSRWTVPLAHLLTCCCFKDPGIWIPKSRQRWQINMWCGAVGLCGGLQVREIATPQGLDLRCPSSTGVWSAITCICLDRFESCWPALMKDSNGVVIVFNPDVPSHLKEMETWHSMFIAPQGLQDGQCLLIAHHKPGSGEGDERVPLGNTNSSSDGQYGSLLSNSLDASRSP